MLDLQLLGYTEFFPKTKVFEFIFYIADYSHRAIFIQELVTFAQVYSSLSRVTREETSLIFNSRFPSHCI